MGDISELEMAAAFDLSLKAGQVKGIPNFKLLYREVICQQGIADFVGLTSDEFIKHYTFEKISSIESSSLVLSLLKQRSGRSKNYLKAKTELSDLTLNRALKELSLSGYILKKEELYFLAVQDDIHNDNIWAFELKLSNWKRALFQAFQYKAFANYSVVVFPLEKEKVLYEHLNSFAEFNIGVLLYDAQTGYSKWLKHVRKEKPISKWQTLFLLAKMSSQHSQENRVMLTIE